MARCDICGKVGGLAPVIKCAQCGKSVCARHEKEQFIATSVQSDMSVLDTWGSVLNYPSGESIKELEFRCYRCRTGNTPTDMGSRTLDPVRLILVFLLISSVAIIGLISFTGLNYLIYFLMLDVIVSMALAFFLSRR